MDHSKLQEHVNKTLDAIIPFDLDVYLLDGEQSDLIDVLWDWNASCGANLQAFLDENEPHFRTQFETLITNMQVEHFGEPFRSLEEHNAITHLIGDWLLAQNWETKRKIQFRSGDYL